MNLTNRLVDTLTPAGDREMVGEASTLGFPISIYDWPTFLTVGNHRFEIVSLGEEDGIYRDAETDVRIVVLND